jgi:phosphate-selective porin
MNRLPIGIVAALALCLPHAAAAADSAEVEELKRMVMELRAEYEQRIRELEQRIAETERAPPAEQVAVDSAPPPATARATVTAGNAFNPQISAILNGNYYHDDIGGEGPELIAEAAQPSHTGHAHGEEEGHSHGAMSNGFNLSEVELAFSATIDPYFDAAAYMAITGDGEFELEEAYLQTRSLPWGLKLKAGKFLSDFGYINRQHPHQWDFADQNLPYLALLGDHGLQDVGVQLNWLPELPLYTLIGVEALQGSQERFGALVEDEEELEELNLDDSKDGPRLWTAYVKISPDLGYSHALQIGASYAHSRQHQEIHEHDEDPDDELPALEEGLEGDADLWGLDVVYKYDDERAYGHGDLKLQAEYLWSSKDLRIRSGEPDEIGANTEFTTDGFYVQGVYGIWPRWQVGLRYDVLGLTNEATGGGEREEFGESDRWTAALSWIPSEFSLIRLQYEHADIALEEGGSESFNAFWLQFLLSMGAHGAHKF